MLFLQALLCFLFGTAVVEARFWPKPPLRVRPITSRRPIIPPASYGYWVRWAIDNPQHRISDSRINDVMRLYQNDNGEVELYQLPNTAQPAFPTFLCALQDNDLVIFVGRWIRFPTLEDSPESRSQLLTAEIVHGVQFRITITSFSISTQTQYERPGHLNGYFYPFGGSEMDRLLQFSYSGMTLWRRGGQSRDFSLTIGLWLPYPMRSTPREHRNRVVDARIVNGRLAIGSFMLRP